MFLDISEDEHYLESNNMHGINGYLYGNLPGLDMCLGDDISWHMIGLGNEIDRHTAYFYGNTFIHNGNVKDAVSLLPGKWHSGPFPCFELCYTALATIMYTGISFQLVLMEASNGKTIL